MGVHLVKKTGNVAAVQHQLGHRNATYTLQYARPSFAEMEGRHRGVSRQPAGSGQVWHEA